MEYLSEIIVKLFRDISPSDIITGKINYRDIDLNTIQQICVSSDNILSEVEIRKKIQSLYDRVSFELYEEGMEKKENYRGLGIFNLINSFARKVFIFRENELVYKYKYLKEWHFLQSQIGEELIVAAAYAYFDSKIGLTRTSFLWKRMLRHNNDLLNCIVDRGVSDNHYHLRCSTPYFELSWLSLMNCVTNHKVVEYQKKMNEEKRNPRIRYRYSFDEERYEILHLKAALIRVYLYALIKKEMVSFGTYYVSIKWMLDYIFSSEKIVQILCKWAEECRKKNQNFPSEDYSTVNEYLRNYITFMSKVITNDKGELMEQFQKQCPLSYWFFFQYYTYIPIACLKDKKCPLNCENIVFMIGYLEVRYPSVKLEDLRCFFIRKGQKIFLQEWNRQTKVTVMNLLKRPKELMRNKRLIQRTINSLLNFKDCSKKDYALNALGDWNESDWEKGIISGERWILYQSMLFQYKNSQAEQDEVLNLLYAYSLIKESFRMELIQTNGKIGFENFRKYQERKNWFTTNYTEAELAKMAVKEAFTNQKMNSLELRIVPADNENENISMIRQYDKVIGESLALITNQISTNNYYYVFHFGKQNDPSIRTGKNMICRHDKYRKKLKQKTNAILLMRKWNPKIGERVKGVDACSSEDGCRPEVFSTAFRVLKNYVVGKKYVFEKIPQLKLSYHVGEDNQDILDGLRAIDEAIFFLNLDAGDRIGHATALGFDTEKWYAEKNFQISIRCMDYLDNIVWLYHKILYYKIPDQENLLEYLRQEFHYYFGRIYLKELNMDYNQRICDEAANYDKEFGNKHYIGNSYLGFDIYNYYNSWQLRGDEPYLYERGYYRRKNMPQGIWDDYAVNRNLKGEVRYILEAGILYHLYHYNGTVKKEGDTAIDVKIPYSMIPAISQVQKKMQKEIAQKGIAIETNPSSNYLISMIHNYAQHPIVSFYNKGLTYNPEKLEECAQLNVSINTDDTGVFSTSLYNEYALMANALETITDTAGNPIYEKHQVYDWLENIRLMGNDQSFVEDKA